MKSVLAGFIALSITAGTVYAQDENPKKVSGQETGQNTLYVGLETSSTAYINTATRDSNGVALYLAPGFDYNHKSGAGLRIRTYILPGGSNPGFFLTAISPYFARYTGRVLPYISYTRYIQHDNLSVPYSPIQNELYAHLRIRTDHLEPWFGMDIGFGHDAQDGDRAVSDVNVFAGMTYLFLKDHLGPGRMNALAVRPGLQLNAATDRYYKFLRTSGYISQNSKGSRIGFGQTRGNNGQGGSEMNGYELFIISEGNDFGLSNIEVQLQIMYFIGRFSIEPSGNLYFPLRGADRSPYGYWQINLNYWFH